MSLIDIDTTSYSNNLPNILMSYNPNSTNSSENTSNINNTRTRQLQSQKSAPITSKLTLLSNVNPNNPPQISKDEYIMDINTGLTMTTENSTKFPNLGNYSCNNLLNNSNFGANTNINTNQIFNSSSTSNNYNYNPSDDVNKAFDITVFDILKVDPDDIAGQLTLIDLPLFKQIQPDELISCKWMSREKLVKAPNIVQFTRRFNQTTFWCQKEILNCKKIETRGKMITIFIKMAKRLNELHSYNSLMAIIVALKAQPIYRLKKTWTQYVSKKDTAQFDRLADILFDTNENKKKIRDMHMNCKLPCIPFLGLFLTDLIHIDIAHPHNSFDNPQRRNQMNNICRLISEYQQSNYQDLTSLSCDCCFSVITEVPEISPNCPINDVVPQISTEQKCLVNNCSCLIHHGHVNGSGFINNDGTIYINDIGYIKNYLNSFLYIEELQKFKEDENYRDSLELEPDETKNIIINSNTESLNGKGCNTNGVNCGKNNMLNDDFIKKPVLHVSPSSPCKLSTNQNQTTNNSNINNHNIQYCIDSTNNSNGLLNNQHRKSQSIASNMFSFNLINETKDLINDLKINKHPLDESIENTNSLPLTQINNSNLPNLTNNKDIGTGICHDLFNEIPLSILQQKQLLQSVKINDPSSLLRELLKHRHNTSALTTTTTSTTSNKSSSHHSSSISFKNKFNCYSSSSADVDDDEESDDDDNFRDLDEDQINQSIDSSDNQNLPFSEVVATQNINSTPIKLFNSSNNENTNKYSDQKSKNTNSKAKKKLLNSTLKSNKSSTVILNATANGNNIHTNLNQENLNDDNFDTVDAASIVNKIGHSHSVASSNRHAASKTSSSSDIFLALNHNLPNMQLNSNNDECSSYTASSYTHELSGITNLSSMLVLEQQLSGAGGNLIMFESPVKRKCIMKNSRKPRFSQWKSYWLQLIGGNLLIYYPIKSIVFNTNIASNKNRQSIDQNSYIEDLISNQTENTQDNPDIHQLHQEIQQQQKKERLQNQLQLKKCCYNKNPCKMHPISNWMVVNLYQDKEIEIIQTAQQLSSTINSNYTQNPPINNQNQSTTSSTNNLNLYTKFDIQLNDLNNGNMYKYRFDSLQLAKEWLEQFKLASTYHEREKPDNLIRFD
jgi:hypothetical protein